MSRKMSQLYQFFLLLFGYLTLTFGSDGTSVQLVCFDSDETFNVNMISTEQNIYEAVFIASNALSCKVYKSNIIFMI